MGFNSIINIMGNSRSAPAAPNNNIPAPSPAHHRQGQYYYPSQPNNMGYEATPPKKKPAVMDCNEAAERYGGYVVAEYGGRKKPLQGREPYSN